VYIVKQDDAREEVRQVGAHTYRGQSPPFSSVLSVQTGRVDDSVLQSIILFAAKYRSTMNNDDTTVMLLPSTVLLQIFHYIDNATDLARLKCVSQRFSSLIERYWQQLIRIDIYDIKCSQMAINNADNKQQQQYCRITFETAATTKINHINGHGSRKFFRIFM